MSKIPVSLSKVFESTIEDPIHEQVRQELLRSRKGPEVIYVRDKAPVYQIEQILTALHGLRGQRTPVLVDPDLRSSYEIKWGS